MVPVPDGPGLVVRYGYLWHRRAQVGAGNPEKDRPACVAFVYNDSEQGRSAILLPITHREPIDDQLGIEIPPKVKEHLGLDHDRSWIIFSECNIDIWPSPDLQPIPGGTGSFAYGYLPPRFFRTLRNRFISEYRQRRVNQVDRSTIS